ncbi:phage protease [Methylocystis sp. WRRC1]|uniref:phage protease n=1 Tax=unclassified Methylocystis TaxID=2625913 RepID=UPI0001F86A8C|nr:MULTISPECIES: phage protease [unclassified Methylocystis]MCC3246147.1 phage protease [Methylocystis sp. WRRC1]
MFGAIAPGRQLHLADMQTASQADFAFHALAAVLPESDAPPEWITIFAKRGRVDTRDGRSFDVDPELLVSRFNADGVDLPVDVNHATHHAALTGSRADAIGWIRELRVDGGALQGRVEWLDEGKALLAARKYRFVSPDFFHTPERRPTWLRSVALVTAPALGNQKALAAASSQENMMDKLASALGVTAGANEAAMLTALEAGFVEKKVHDETLAQLAATSKELSDIKAAGRKAQVDALLEDAVKGKKIVPAEREHYARLCATDAGLETVKALLSAKTPVLSGSGLDDKKPPEGGGVPTGAQLAAEARGLVSAGKAPDFMSAMAALEAKYQATA